MDWKDVAREFGFTSDESMTIGARSLKMAKEIARLREKLSQRNLMAEAAIALEAKPAQSEEKRIDWKWEYENLCKFADDFQNSRDAWKSYAMGLREALQ